MPPRAVGVHVDREERRHVRDAGGLLHVVGDHDDRVLALEVVHQVLDRGGRDGIERRGRLVHEEDVGLGRERARDAQPLLLAAREAERGVLQPVLDLVPERGAAQAGLDALVEAVLQPERAGPEGDVVVDRLGERVGLLEDHADPAADLDRVDVPGVEILAVIRHGALDGRARDQVVHPVEAADEGRLAAPGRPDERRHGLLVDVDADALQRELAVVGDVQVGDVEHGLAALDVPACRTERDLGDARARDGRRVGREARVGRRWVSFGRHLWHDLSHQFCRKRLRRKIASAFIVSTIPSSTMIAPAASVWNAGSGSLTQV